MKFWQRILIALTLAVIAGAATGSLAYLNSLIVTPPPAKEHGAFHPELDADLFQRATEYAERKISAPGATCVSQWVGTDDAYVYLAIGCAKFMRQYGEVRAYGDQGFRAVRIRRWWGKKLFGFDQADPDQIHASLKALFPHTVAQEWWKRSSPRVFLEQGAKLAGI